MVAYRGASWPAGKVLSRARAAMLFHVSQAQGLMHLLKKSRNGMSWSKEDKIALRRHLNHLAKALPAFGIFSLPGGLLIMPLLATFLERRKLRGRAASVPPLDRTHINGS